MTTANMKYSRQREAIRSFLMSRKDHPTAEAVYANVKSLYPRISLGTVYRNLSLLVECGEATKFPGTDGFDHFDGNTSPHYHFICNKCNRIMDVDFPQMDFINEAAGKTFPGRIEGHTAYFYGSCPDCLTENNFQ